MLCLSFFHVLPNESKMWSSLKSDGSRHLHWLLLGGGCSRSWIPITTTPWMPMRSGLGAYHPRVTLRAGLAQMSQTWGKEQHVSSHQFVCSFLGTIHSNPGCFWTFIFDRPGPRRLRPCCKSQRSGKSWPTASWHEHLVEQTQADPTGSTGSGPNTQGWKRERSGTAQSLKNRGIRCIGPPDVAGP